MPFILQTLIVFWRQRLQQIEARLAILHYDSWRLQLERRVIAFFLRRHSDGPGARPPARAATLDPEGHERSNRLFLRTEVKDRLRGHVAGSYSEFDYQPPPKPKPVIPVVTGYSGQEDSLDRSSVESNVQLILLIVLCILLLIDLALRLS